MKKVISRVLLTLMVLLNFSGAAFAQVGEGTPTPSADTIDRVYEEILTGNITSHEDVLAVALAQYAGSPRAYSSENKDEPLQITQVLDVQQHADGTTEADFAVTALAVVDDNGIPYSMADEYYHMTKPGGLAGYQVYATHTMYTKGYYDANNPIIKPQRHIQVVKMETTITSMPSETVTKLIHRYGEVLDPVDLEVNIEESPVSYPQYKQTYSFSPRRSSLVATPNVLGTYIQTSVEIFVGSRSFVIENTIPLDTSRLPGELEYGW